jgi:hypothetical protein
MQGKVIGQQMQRDPSTMEMNGQRPQTPGDNAPSPSKRPRIDNGAFDGQGMMNRVAGMQQGGNVGANGSQPMMQNGQMAGFAPGAGAPLKMEVRIVKAVSHFVFPRLNHHLDHERYASSGYWRSINGR